MRLNFKMNPRQTPGFSCNRVLKECLFSQGFQKRKPWAMLKIPRSIRLNFKMNPRLTPRIFVQSGFERMLVVPELSKADLLGDVENPTFYEAQL